MIAMIILPPLSPFYNAYAGIRTKFTLPHNPLSFDIQQGHCLDFIGIHSSPWFKNFPNITVTNNKPFIVKIHLDFDCRW